MPCSRSGSARGLNACPAAPEAICAFIADEARNGTKVATITRRIAAIRYAHALKGIDPLPTSSEAVKATMKGIRRTRGTAPIRKAPATHGIIADMIARCPDTLRGRRDRALLLLGFAGAFRRSELAALAVSDLTADEAGLRVTVRRAKADQEGKGQVVAILAGTRLKPVYAVTEWLEVAGITEGPVFRAIDRHGNVLPEALSTRSIAEIVKKYVGRIGLDAGQFSAHSLRAGFITSAAKSGAGQDHGRFPTPLGRDCARLCPRRRAFQGSRGRGFLMSSLLDESGPAGAVNTRPGLTTTDEREIIDHG